MSGFRRPPLIVPGRPSTEMAAEFPCPFCNGTAYYGDLELVAAAAGHRGPNPGGAGVAHSQPSCETFKRLTAEQFRDACTRRMSQ